jgi:hypothetical protein
MAHGGAWLGRMLGLTAAIISLGFVDTAPGAAEGQVVLSQAMEVEPGPHGCLDGERLATQTGIWLERSTIDARVRVRAIADPTRRDRVHFSIERDGEVILDRPFEPVPPDCEATHAALGLAVAIALDATVLQPFAEVHEASAPPSTPVESEEVTPDSGPGGVAVDGTGVPMPDRGTKTARPVSVSVQAAASAGLTPLASVGGRLDGTIMLGKIAQLRLGAMAQAGFPVAVGPGRARVTLLAGRVGTCLTGARARTRIGGCASGWVGAAGVSGRGYETELSSFKPWVAAALGPTLMTPVGRGAALVVDAELVVPLFKPRLVVRDAETGAVGAARTLPPVGGVVAVGVAFGG